MEQRKIGRGPSRGHLMAQLARLESMNDQLQTEITVVDELLRAIGFDSGLTTLKKAVLECLTAE